MSLARRQRDRIARQGLFQHRNAGGRIALVALVDCLRHGGIYVLLVGRLIKVGEQRQYVASADWPNAVNGASAIPAIRNVPRIFIACSFRVWLRDSSLPPGTTEVGRADALPGLLPLGHYCRTAQSLVNAIAPALSTQSRTPILTTHRNSSRSSTVSSGCQKVIMSVYRCFVPALSTQ
jgi:hypothetical protein